MTLLIAFTINFVTLVAGTVTIIWFFRDLRKENSKMFKEMTTLVRDSQQILSDHTRLLKEIEQILSDHTRLFKEIIEILKK